MLFAIILLLNSFFAAPVPRYPPAKTPLQRYPPALKSVLYDAEDLDDVAVSTVLGALWTAYNVYCAASTVMKWIFGDDEGESLAFDAEDLDDSAADIVKAIIEYGPGIIDLLDQAGKLIGSWFGNNAPQMQFSVPETSMIKLGSGISVGDVYPPWYSPMDILLQNPEFRKKILNMTKSKNLSYDVEELEDNYVAIIEAIIEYGPGIIQMIDTVCTWIGGLFGDDKTESLAFDTEEKKRDLIPPTFPAINPDPIRIKELISKNPHLLKRTSGAHKTKSLSYDAEELDDNVGDIVKGIIEYGPGLVDLIDSVSKLIRSWFGNDEMESLAFDADEQKIFKMPKVAAGKSSPPVSHKIDKDTRKRIIDLPSQLVGPKEKSIPRYRL